ncbi:MAG: glycosyltransferase family 9 protein [Woeseiaceae bacterium]
MSFNYSSTPPKSICILRLSALGDITHALPIFYTLRHTWPETKITWIIGKLEYELVKHIGGVEFIIFDKNGGLSAYNKMRQDLISQRFDVLLHMQMSLRASLISLLIKAKIKIGFDKKRAKDLQWLFTNTKIQNKKNQHVIDSFFCFTEAMGIKEKQYQWDIPLIEEDVIAAKKLLNTDSKYITISPCSSKAYRNWNTPGYAAIADYVSQKYHYKVVLTGGSSEIEHQYANEIKQQASCSLVNLVGKTSVRELLSIIKNTEFMVSPDSGPAHMATAMNTPVVGLYASTNPDRARPYLSADWTIDRYPEAILKKYNKNIADVAWGTRVRELWAMDLITIEDVKNKIDKFMLENYK